MSDYRERRLREMRELARQQGDTPNALRFALLTELATHSRAFAYRLDTFENWSNVMMQTAAQPVSASDEAKKHLQDVVIDAEDKECSICLVDFKKCEIVKKMPCQHIFHSICLLTWLENNMTCPFCRAKLE